MELIFSLLEWCETHLLTLQAPDLLSHLPSNLITDTSVLMKYMPFFPFLVLFYPLIVTISIALFSASAWLFWLITSVVLGTIQVFYASYQFLMIFNDIGILSVLKTFSTIRSQIRSYTIQSGLSKKTTKPTRRGRRKEWRQKLDKATSYEEFLEVEIEDPPVKNEDGTNAAAAAANVDEPKKDKSRIRHTITTLVTNCKSKLTNSPTKKGGKPPLATRQARRKTMHSITKSGTPLTPNPAPKRKIRMPTSDSLQRARSCVDLSDSINPNGANLGNGVVRSGLNKSVNGSSMLDSISRNMSSENFLRSKSDDEQRENDAMKTRAALEKELGMTGGLLSTTTDRLREARIQASSSIARGGKNGRMSAAAAAQDIDNSLSSLKFLLTGVVKRNHLSVDDLLIDDSRSVAECGRYRLSPDARRLIQGYNEEVERCLEYIADSPVVGGASVDGGGGTTNPIDMSLSLTQSQIAEAKDIVGRLPSDLDESSPDVLQKQYMELTDRLHLVRKLKQNMGRSALMLSGGGAQAMYHLGTIKALIESNLYDKIKVISGTSGGSISAAMCAMKTPEELHEHICVKTVSTDYMGTGRMKRENIRWFPTLVEMGTFWFKNGLLVDSTDFKRCCDFYYGDTTFEEAFKHTGKHVCITVSASRATASSGSGGQRLLLNHISTPHVTLASAVAASCALPGLMNPRKLIVKNSAGEQEPFEVDGVEWIDGSVQADLPFRRISTLFNVSNYIVCQTNFHVVPFLNKSHHPSVQSLYWKIFQMCEWDIRSRALNLGRLGLFPKLFGQDMSKVFKQKYHGNLTLVPRFTTMQTFGLKALANPTVADMENYLQNGQVAAWPYCGVIREMLRLESAIDKCISQLDERIEALGPGGDWQMRDDDDVESISSSTAHIGSSVASRAHYLSTRRENELLKQQNQSLQLENEALKKQVVQLHRALGIERQEGSDAEWDMVVRRINVSVPNDIGKGEEGKEEKVESPKSI